MNKLQLEKIADIAIKAINRYDPYISGEEVGRVGNCNICDTVVNRRNCPFCVNGRYDCHGSITNPALKKHISINRWGDRVVLQRASLAGLGIDARNSGDSGTCKIWQAELIYRLKGYCRENKLPFTIVRA